MSVRAFVFDLDGVLYRGKQPLPGAVQAVDTLRRLGYQVYFFTNNSSKTRQEYAQKLSQMGLKCDIDHIMTSSYATALYFLERNAQGKKVFVVGMNGIRDELARIGMKLVEDDRYSDADFVVVGIDKNFTYEKLAKAQKAILAGAEFIATNRDATFPTENGGILPGGGAIVAAIEVAVGRSPVLIGKPSTYAMEKVIRLAGADPTEVAVVGDRLDTDILAANRMGAISVLVLTGIATRKDAETAPKEMRPCFIIESLSELPKLFVENYERSHCADNCGV